MEVDCLRRPPPLNALKAFEAGSQHLHPEIVSALSPPLALADNGRQAPLIIVGLRQ